MKSCVKAYIHCKNHISLQYAPSYGEAVDLGIEDRVSVWLL